MMRGDWAQAEADLEWAAGELSTLRPPLAGYARARLAQLRRRQGRPARGPRAALLAGGHVLAPLVEAELALDEDDPAGRARPCGALPARARRRAADRERRGVRAAGRARPDPARASPRRAAHARLAAIADAVGTTALRAAERCRRPDRARRARPEAARARWRTPSTLYELAPPPFEAAQARLELARALAAQDRPRPALEQALAARAAFEDLGAERAA